MCRESQKIKETITFVISHPVLLKGMFFSNTLVAPFCFVSYNFGSDNFIGSKDSIYLDACFSVYWSWERFPFLKSLNSLSNLQG
jgi:hypothetical protein